MGRRQASGTGTGSWSVHGRVPSEECGGNEMAPHCFKSDSVSPGEVDTDSREGGVQEL